MFSDHTKLSMSGEVWLSAWSYVVNISNSTRLRVNTTPPPPLTPTGQLCLVHGGPFVHSLRGSALTASPPPNTPDGLDRCVRFLSLQGTTIPLRTKKKTNPRNWVLSVLAHIRSFCHLSRSSLGCLISLNDPFPRTLRGLPTPLLPLMAGPILVFLPMMVAYSSVAPENGGCDGLLSWRGKCWDMGGHLWRSRLALSFSKRTVIQGGWHHHGCF